MLQIYSSEDAFVNGQSALAHVRLTDGELRLLNEVRPIPWLADALQIRRQYISNAHSAPETAEAGRTHWLLVAGCTLLV